MTGATWGAVHVGDTVRGADQRAWEVTGRRAAETWALAGERAAYSLRRGERVVEIKRALSAPADVISRADHAAEAGAIAALIETGIRFDVLKEQVTVTQQVDPFDTPAAGTAESQIERDRWGRYKLPDPVTGADRTWTRASTVARTLADEYNLARWGERMTAKGLASRPDLIAGAVAADPERDKGTLDGIVKQAKDAAAASAGANLGTALHSFTERLDAGTPLASLGAPPPLDGDLRTYAELMRAASLRIRYAERVVVCPELGVAGKFDRIVAQPSGNAHADPLAILDLKTGKTVEYGWLEIAIQLAIYAHASHIWDPATRTYEAMPAVDQSRALVVHLPVGKASPNLYGVDIAEGWKHAQTAMAAREARSGAKKLAWLVDPDAEALLLHRIARADRTELAALWERLQPAGKWTPAVDAAAQARFAELLAQPA